VVESQLLAGNPLGDPSTRPLYVYQSPGLAQGRVERAPTIYMLQGFSGQLDTWLARKAFEPTLVERLDAMFATEQCPEAIVVFFDAWTSRGGSQFLNSSSTGRYMDYLCDEVVPFIDDRYPVMADRRGLVGGSSGGYGAMTTAMLRPELFNGIGSIAGDALFEYSYQCTFPAVARTLRDRFEGSFEVLFDRLSQADRFDWARLGEAFMVYGCACCYSPDPGRPGEALLPFEISTARLVGDVWERWLSWDPVRMASQHRDALGSMRRIVLEAGRGDEYFLDLGAQAFAEELEKLGVAHSLELFDGKHGGAGYRYPGVIRELLIALAA
jgi:enterochelin esterase-like enzyme